MRENDASLLQVMQRYTTHAPLHDVNRDFIAALLRSFDEKPFRPVDFDAFPIELVMDYIRRTHVFYLQKKLPEIEQSIHLLSGLYTSQHPILAALQNFFTRYCQELTEHIHAEETTLLPYIDLLRRSASSPRSFSEYALCHGEYSIARFLSEHHDTEDELRDIRSTIRLYEPPAVNASLYRILLAQLQAFEKDLCMHSDIEEHVLVPKALAIEARLHAQIGAIKGLN